MKIGNGFNGQTEKEKKQYISLTFDKGAMALYPILKEIKLTLWYIPREERKSEKSPAWGLHLNEAYKAEEKSSAQGSSDVAADEEIPF